MSSPTIADLQNSLETINGHITALYKVRSKSIVGPPGKSVFDIYKEQPGNSNKTWVDFQETLKGDKAENVFDLWKATKSEMEDSSFNAFLETLKSTTPGPQGLPGERGQDGSPGIQGLSAYQVYTRDINPSGSISDFFNYLKGDSAYDVWKSHQDPSADNSYNAFIQSLKPATTYESWKMTKQETEPRSFNDFLATLKGADGRSAYQIWQDLGNTGTQEEFLESLRGPRGADSLVPGPSMYDTWLDAGNLGSLDDFYMSLLPQDFRDTVSTLESDVTDLKTKSTITLQNQSDIQTINSTLNNLPDLSSIGGFGKHLTNETGIIQSLTDAPGFNIGFLWMGEFSEYRDMLTIKKNGIIKFRLIAIPHGGSYSFTTSSNTSPELATNDPSVFWVWKRKY